MDPEALLDHAVFQLTPTRTRCDLVIFYGGVSEKIASGLVGPFVSHLKYAKDQLPKGGYSIRLTPPTNADASWFTKSTFQRFVRFVSTPEVLERFAGLEKEILQIESSVQSNENAMNHEVDGTLSTVNGFSKHSPNAASKVKNETEGIDGSAGQEENSKIRLQRLMETRKALLRKEQAMAYARALAAGFELENIDDLLYFADAFGASRLREACTAFKDLCKKKHGDGLWMDELAAMQAAYAQLEQPYIATPGIVLTSDCNNGLDQSTDSISSSENNNGGAAAPDQIQQNANVQMQMPWPNQIPPYMFNFQKQMQNMSPYQAYPFPGMPPPYYNMGWPPNMDEQGRNHRTSSKKKKKSPNREADEEEEEEDELTESEPENESDTRRSQSNKKKQQKSSSKTVVIKNINYITSDKRNGEEDESSNAEDDDSAEDETDEDSLKQVHEIIGSIQKHHQKSNLNKKKKRSGQKGSARQEVENNGGSDKVKEVKGNDNWENFQNLLMRDDDPPTDMVENHQSVVQNDFESGNSRSFDLASEKLNNKRNFGMDSFVVSERNQVNDGRGMEDFANGESFRPSMKIRESGDDSMLFSQRLSGSGNVTREGYFPDSSTIKHGKGEDWFVANHSGTSETDAISGQNMFEGNFTSPSNANVEKGEKVVPIDDSFMVTTRNSVDDHFDSQWETDMSMLSGVANSSQTETPNKLDTRNSLEPDDLCAVFSRDSAIGPVGASWSSEMDYGVEISFVEPIQKPATVETIVPVQVEAPENGNSPNPKKQTRTKSSSPGSLSKIKSDFLSRNKTPVTARKPITPKSKLEKEEEARKRMEEQMIERQKRIAERSAASGVAKKLPVLASKVSPNKPGQLKKTSTK